MTGIEAVNKTNLEDILPLIHAYRSFYKLDVQSDEQQRCFFSQFGWKKNEGCQFLYRKKNRAIAFATLYFSYVSSLPGKVAILNDLFVEEAHRAQGIGRKLIQHCWCYSKEEGALRLQWLTADDNKRAQALYDSLPTQKSAWQVYTYTGE